MVPVRRQLLQQSSLTQFAPSGHDRAGRASGGRHIHSTLWNAFGRMQVSHIRTKKDTSSSRGALNRQFVLLPVAQLLRVQV